MSSDKPIKPGSQLGLGPASSGVGGGSSQQRFSDIAALSESDKSIVATYSDLFLRAIAGSGSSTSLPITLGVYHGTERWDLRPVFLNPEAGNSLHIFRAATIDQSNEHRLVREFQSLPKFLPDAYRLADAQNVSLEGKEQKICWSVRKFCESTLQDPIDSTAVSAGSVDFSNSCFRLLSQLSALESQGCPHAHLVPSNIGFSDQQLFLLDPWYFAIGARSAGAQTALSARTFSSLMINRFASSLSPALIHAFQSTLSAVSDPRSEEAAPFTRLFALCQNERHSDIMRQPNPSLPSAPTGKLIQPRTRKPSETNPPISPEAEQRVRPSDNDVSAEATIVVPQSFSLPPSSAPAPIPEPNADSSPLRPWIFFFVALSTAILVLWGSRALRLFPSEESLRAMQQDWESNDIVRLKRVAEAALDSDDPNAQQIIERDLLAGGERPGVNAKFMKVAFNELWRNQLNNNDRTFALSLALAGLYRVDSEKLASLESLHPGVVLSLLGDLSLEGGQGKFSNIDTERLAQLPDPYGAAFASLKKLGTENFGDAVARAAARIVSGADDRATFDIFIPANLESSLAEKRLVTIVPFCEMYPNLPSTALAALAERPDTLGERVKWFVSDQIAEWNGAEAKFLLYIVVGLVPDQAKNFERLADLLQFPAAGVRAQAAADLLKNFDSQAFQGLIELLAKPPHPLSRTQTIGLLASLRLSPDKAGPFLGSWLGTNPNPQIVLEVLLALREKKAYDSVFVQLANHLARADFETSPLQLGQLLTHPEPLARALVFPRLDAKRPSDRKILEAWLARENSARLKEQIQVKLNAGLN